MRGYLKVYMSSTIITMFAYRSLMQLGLSDLLCHIDVGQEF